MFSGSYEYRLDGKGRVSIPARLREPFLPGVVLVRGFEPCINAYPALEWQKLFQPSAPKPFYKAKERDLKRQVLGRSFETQLDGQGRVVLPLPLREYARISQEVVIVGVGEYLELWSPEQWKEKEAELDASAWNLAESTEER